MIASASPRASARRREHARCKCENRRERLATIHDEEEVVIGARARVERRGDFRKAPELCAGAAGILEKPAALAEVHAAVLYAYEAPTQWPSFVSAVGSSAT